MIEKAKTYWANSVEFFWWVLNWRRLAFIAVAFVIGAAARQGFDPQRPQTQLVPTLQYLTAADLNGINAQIKFMDGEIEKLRRGQVAIGEDFVGRLEKLEAWQAKYSPVTTGSTSKQKR